MLTKQTMMMIVCGHDDAVDTDHQTNNDDDETMMIMIVCGHAYQGLSDSSKVEGSQ